MLSNITLDVDVGNTRVKWMLFDAANAVLDKGAFDNDKIDSAIELLRFYSVGRVRISCVADEFLRIKIGNLCKSLWGIDPEFAGVTHSYAGLKNSYSVPDSLGIDRWLAALAAWRLSSGACLIVDAGSAITIDAIDDNGVYLGGYIIPGWSMMHKSLVRGTGRINCRASGPIKWPAREMPNSTDLAVQQGVALAVLASVQMAAENFMLQWPHGRVYVTGGDGADISNVLPIANHYAPDLVLQGLAVALP
jgi:type III pantothenate kinase